MNRKIFYLCLLVLIFSISNTNFFGFSSPLKSQELFNSDSRIAERTSEEQRTIDVYKKASQAVVYISTTTLTVDPDEFFPEIRPQKGSGSGVIVDAERGIIVTNLHVVSEANQIETILANGRNYSTRAIGIDAENDIAVLQLREKPKTLYAVPFADSSNLEVGQKVLAIGNPFGLNRTLTAGIISSLDRTVKGSGQVMLRGLIQTDAAINPGNSGGPLLDMEGRLIGINSAILSASGDSAGIGFAVPINRIKRVLPEIIATGRVLRLKFGWQIVDTDQGAMVKQVIPKGPADQAGIVGALRIMRYGALQQYVFDYSKADLIVAINGEKVFNRDQLENFISQIERNIEIELTLKRGGIDGEARKIKIKPVLQ